MTIRTDGQQQYLSIVNFSEENFPLPEHFGGYDLCSQTEFGKSSEVLAKDAVILRLNQIHIW
jgi:hypothetical protein